MWRKTKEVTNKEFKEINFIYFKFIILLILIVTPINEVLAKKTIKFTQMNFQQITTKFIYQSIIQSNITI